VFSARLIPTLAPVLVGGCVGSSHGSSGSFRSPYLSPPRSNRENEESIPTVPRRCLVVACSRFLRVAPPADYVELVSVPFTWEVVSSSVGTPLFFFFSGPPLATFTVIRAVLALGAFLDLMHPSVRDSVFSQRPLLDDFVPPLSDCGKRIVGIVPHDGDFVDVPLFTGGHGLMSYLFLIKNMPDAFVSFPSSLAVSRMAGFLMSVLMPPKLRIPSA